MISRVRKEKRYTVVDNGYLYDPDLSLLAVGLLTLVFSYPDNHTITIKLIASTRHKDTTYAVGKAMTELIEAGYCKRTPRNGQGGRLSGWDYTVFEEKQPLTDKPNTLVGESTDTRITDVGKTQFNISTIDSSIDTKSSSTKNVDRIESISSTDEIFLNGDFLGLGKLEEEVGVIPTNPKPERKSSAKKKEDVSLVPIPTSLQTPEFTQVWVKLIAMAKWRNKPTSAVELSLCKLSNYKVGFAIELVELAIQGAYQGVVFSDTAEKYQKWLKSHANEPKQQTGTDAFRQRALTQIKQLNSEFAAQQE